MRRLLAVLLATALAASRARRAARSSTPAGRRATTRDVQDRSIEIPTVLGRGTDAGDGRPISPTSCKAAGFAGRRHHDHALRQGARHRRRQDRGADRPLARRASRRQEADPADGAHGRGRGQARGLEVRPVQVIEKDGYFYGRGTSDNEAGRGRHHRGADQAQGSGFKPKRDIIVCFTGDEETKGNGARSGATEWRDAARRRICAQRRWRRRRLHRGRARARLRACRPPRRPSSPITSPRATRAATAVRPRPDNAIYDLPHALERLEAIASRRCSTRPRAPISPSAPSRRTGALGEAMRAWLANPNDGAAADAIEASELEVGMTRTRCVATMLEGGHADNALPQLAQATVNCRIMPGVDPKTVEAELQDGRRPEVEVTPFANQGRSRRPRRCAPTWSRPITEAVRRTHGADVQIIPQMSTGATDGALFPRRRDPGLRGRRHLGHFARRRARPRPRRAAAGQGALRQCPALGISGADARRG